MEVEARYALCSPDSINEAAMEEEEPSSEKPLSSAAGDDSANPCFDCNICLSFAADPVVTLCGHLYCWPCIYRWLHLDSVDGRSHCPVCRSLFSESSLIPLYGSGLNAKSHGIPDRPKDHRKLVAVDRRQQIYPFYRDGQGRSMELLHSNAGVVVDEMVPRASTNQQYFYQSPEMVAGGSRGSRRRRRRRSLQELRAESFLHQLWVFLFCCAVLCFVFF